MYRILTFVKNREKLEHISGFAYNKHKDPLEDFKKKIIATEWGSGGYVGF